MGGVPVVSAMELGTVEQSMSEEVDFHKAAVARSGDASDPRHADLAATHASVWGQLQRLKPWTAAALGALVLLVLVFGLWHWQLMVIVCALLVPTLGQLVRWWSRNPERCPLDHVLASYVSGLFVLSVTAMGTASVALVAASVVLGPLFGMLHLFDVWQLGMLLFIFALWGVFCFVEDLWLVTSLRGAKRRRAHHQTSAAQRRTAGVVYATASAVGYATAQCVALMCIVTAIMEGHTAFELHEEKAADGEITVNEAGFLFVLTVVFAWYWLPVRLLASHLEALEIERAPEAPEAADGCDALCPLPPAPGGAAPDRSSCCCERFAGLVRVILWPWALRTTHFTFFLYWFLVLAEVHLFLWLGVAFLTWCLVVYVAIRRIKFLEEKIDPGAVAATGLRELYGFALLAGDEDGAAAATAETSAGVV